MTSDKRSTPSHSDALGEVVASLKKQIAAIEGDDDCFWPACILGTEEAKLLVNAIASTPPTSKESKQFELCAACSTQLKCASARCCIYPAVAWGAAFIRAER